VTGIGGLTENSVMLRYDSTSSPVWKHPGSLPAHENVSPGEGNEGQEGNRGRNPNTFTSLPEKWSAACEMNRHWIEE